MVLTVSRLAGSSVVGDSGVPSEVLVLGRTVTTVAANLEIVRGDQAVRGKDVVSFEDVFSRKHMLLLFGR